MHTTTSRPTSGTEIPDPAANPCRNCRGTGRMADNVSAAITHRSRTVQRRCRYCEGTGQLAPAAAPAENEIGEIPAWMLGIDEDDEAASVEQAEVQQPASDSATETVEARELRKDDVIVNSAGEDIPVLLVMPHNGLIMIWTSPTNCFALSASVTVQIKRRIETVKARDLRGGDAVKGAIPGDFVTIASVSRGLVWDGPVDEASVIADFGTEGTWPYRANDNVEIARRNGGA